MKCSCWLVVVLWLAACASETPPPEAPTASHASSPRKKSRGAKSLSPEQLRRVMNKKSLAMAGCAELSENKDSLSSMTIEFEVGKDGKVSGEHIADGDVDDVLRDCVLGVVRDARFPKSGAATDVSWPLRFRSNQ